MLINMNIFLWHRYWQQIDRFNKKTLKVAR